MTATCPRCGTELASATIDEAPAPDPDIDHAQAEFDAQRMAAVSFCPNEQCPAYRQPVPDEDAGAQL